MKTAGGVLGIIGGALNAIFAYIAYAAAAVIGAAGTAFVEAAADATGSSADAALALDAANVTSAVTGYMLVWLLVSLALLVAGIMALAMKSSKLAGIIMIMPLIY